MIVYSDIFLVSHGEASRMIRSYHYLKTLPKTIGLNLARRSGGRIVQLACYGPVHSAKAPDGFLELRRLCQHPDYKEATLSSFLGKTLRFLKQRKVAAVLAWSDLAAGHHGGIYQATNWIYTEPYSYNWNYHFRKPDGSIVDHRRAFAMFGTSSRDKVLAQEPTWEAFLPPMKMRYVMPLCMKQAEVLAVLKAIQRPYPKPDIKPVPKRIGPERRVTFQQTGRA